MRLATRSAVLGKWGPPSVSHACLGSPQAPIVRIPTHPHTPATYYHKHLMKGMRPNSWGAWMGTPPPARIVKTMSQETVGNQIERRLERPYPSPDRTLRVMLHYKASRGKCPTRAKLACGGRSGMIHYARARIDSPAVPIPISEGTGLKHPPAQ